MEDSSIIFHNQQGQSNLLHTQESNVKDKRKTRVSVKEPHGKIRDK